MSDMNFELDESGIVVRCPSCQTRNRLKYENLGGETRCGNCKTPLGVEEPVDLHSGRDFERLTGKSAVPVLIDFWAPWCGPCKMVAPEVAKVAATSKGEFIVAKLNTDEVSDVAMQYQISSIPTMAIFHEGREMTRMAGARPAAGILDFVRKAAGLATKS
jgi:thioredoxin 2